MSRLTIPIELFDIGLLEGMNDQQIKDLQDELTFNYSSDELRVITSSYAQLMNDSKNKLVLCERIDNELHLRVEKARILAYFARGLADLICNPGIGKVLTPLNCEYNYYGYSLRYCQELNNLATKLEYADLSIENTRRKIIYHLITLRCYGLIVYTMRDNFTFEDGFSSISRSISSLTHNTSALKFEISNLTNLVF